MEGTQHVKGKKAKNTSTSMVNKKGGQETTITIQTSQGNLHVAPSAMVIVIADLMQVEAEAATNGWETIRGQIKVKRGTRFAAGACLTVKALWLIMTVRKGMQ